MLTHRQHQLLTYLRERCAENGEAPSLSEMAAAMGLRSKGSVHRLVRGLEARGRIRRLARRWRAIEVVDAPGAAAELITEILSGGAAPAVELALPGWCARARALMPMGRGSRHAVESAGPNRTQPARRAR